MIDMWSTLFVIFIITIDISLSSSSSRPPSMWPKSKQQMNHAILSNARTSTIQFPLFRFMKMISAWSSLVRCLIRPTLVSMESIASALFNYSDDPTSVEYPASDRHTDDLILYNKSIARTYRTHHIAPRKMR